MKRLIKRLLFSFILLITCPFFMLNASTQPETGAENLVKEALSDLHDKSLERAEQNISLESALQEMAGQKNVISRNSPASSATSTDQTRPSVGTSTAPDVTRPKPAAAQKIAIKPPASVSGRSSAVLAKDEPGKGEEKTVVYGPDKAPEAPFEDEMFQINENLYVSAGDSDRPFDPLAPRLDTFPGDKHTLSQMDKKTPMEGTVLYRLDKKKSAKLQINSDDEKSPIYTPRPHDRDMTSTGLFLDMEVRDDLQLELGGHRRTMADETGRFPNGFTDTGTSLGFKYSF